jgi:hypothetical protein
MRYSGPAAARGERQSDGSANAVGAAGDDDNQALHPQLLGSGSLVQARISAPEQIVPALPSCRKPIAGKSLELCAR